MAPLPINSLPCISISIVFKGKGSVGQWTYDCNNWLLTMDSTMDLPRTCTIFVDVLSRFWWLQSASDSIRSLSCGT